MKKTFLLILVLMFAVGLYVYWDTVETFFSSERCAEGEVYDPQQGSCITLDEHEMEPDAEPPPATFTIDAVDQVVLDIEDAAVGTLALTRDGEAVQPFSAQFETEHSPVDGIATVLDEHVAYRAQTGDVLMPYAVNYGGSGTFVFIGVFLQEDATLKLQDSYSLGDRILIDDVRFGAGEDTHTAYVDFRDRRADEAMVAVPTVRIEAKVRVTDHLFGEVEVRRGE